MCMISIISSTFMNQFYILFVLFVIVLLVFAEKTHLLIVFNVFSNQLALLWCPCVYCFELTSVTVLYLTILSSYLSLHFRTLLVF